MSTNYIPAMDSLLIAWSANFSALITNSPSTYGLAAGDAVIIAAADATWQTAYAISVAPATRTPVTVAAKNAARVSLLAVERPYAQRLANNAGISVSLKTALGLNPRTNTPTPIPVPVTNPVLTSDVSLTHQDIIRYRDSTASPSNKSKPFGAKFLQLHALVSSTGSPTVSVNLWPLVGNFTKSPLIVANAASNAGSLVYYSAAWMTGTGLRGPFSPIVSKVIT